MKNTTDFNGNGSGTMKPFDRLSGWTLSQRVDTQTKARPRQDNRKRKFTFFALTLFKKKKNKKELPPLNFSSRFLSPSSFSTFASRAVLFVEKFTNKTCTPFGKLAKELNPSRQTKTSAKKNSFTSNKSVKNYFVILNVMNKHTFVMTLSVSLILAVMLSFGGCKKIDVPKGTPKCIKEKIKKDKEKNCLSTVYEYDYLGKKVYFFSYSCPEGCLVLLDENCKDVKDMNGTLICICTFGGTSCSSDFMNNRTNEKIIWQK